MSIPEGIRDALADLRRCGALPGAASHFRSADLVERAAALVPDQVPAYSDSRNPDLLPGLRAHLGEHAETVAKLLGGERELALDFVDRFASTQAGNRFPLDAVLNGYRVLTKQLADAVREAAIAGSDPDAELRRVVAMSHAFAAEYSNQVASRVTREYVTATRQLAEDDGERRNELFELLLDGYDEADSRAARLLRRGGYLQQRQTYCVIAVRAVNPAEMENAARVRRIEDAIDDVLIDLPVRRLSGSRDGRVVAILSATSRLSGYTKPHTVVSELIEPALRRLGNAVFVGVSRDVPSTAHIRRALSEASMALDLARLDHRVVMAATVPFASKVIDIAREQARAVLPGWLEGFRSADRRGKLADSVTAYADNDMNTQRTAKAMGVHPNTLYARFEKIHEVTGLDPTEFHALSELQLALAIAADR